MVRDALAQRRQRDTQKNELKPHLKKTWWIGHINAAFLAQMERLLWLYSLPVDSRFPVVCFDERPCFLIGETVSALALKAGSVRKEHYEYAKHGSCALLAAIEPKPGRSLAQVYDQRCKREYALFLKELAAHYPQAVKIRLVQDNLNTHNASSLYETFPAEEAFRLAQRFEFYYTPKKASWLNRQEIEFSAPCPAMFASAHRHESRTGTRGLKSCQRTSSKSDHDRVAIFHRRGAHQVEPALRASASGKCQIQRYLNYRVLSEQAQRVICPLIYPLEFEIT